VKIVKNDELICSVFVMTGDGGALQDMTNDTNAR
jgi:hypothetical protein